MLEINQAGLSWLTILKKADAFPSCVRRLRRGPRGRLRRARPGPAARRRRDHPQPPEGRCRDRQRRGRSKSCAAPTAVRRVARRPPPRPKDEWVRLFKRTFRFTGGEITGEFLMSTGWIDGAHHPACPVRTEILALGPPWAR
ncbi:MAG: hypothetical protein R2711_12500 [Acidimicrobiales bacterium]